MTEKYHNTPSSVKPKVSLKEIFEASFQQSWLEKAINFLYDHLKSNSFLAVQIEGERRLIPMAKRGTRRYAVKEHRRLQEIQWQIDHLVQTYQESKSILWTNTLFVTLTTQYNPHDLKSIVESYAKVKAWLPKFLRQFKNKKQKRFFGNMTAYVVGIEAHELGGCHCHLVLMFDQPIRCERMWSEKEGKYAWRVPDFLLKDIKRRWNGNVDVRGAETPAIAGYLMKELGKANHVEYAIRRWLKRRETGETPQTKKEIAQYKKDVKKIWLYYFAIKCGFRILQVSKALPRLDYSKNKSTEMEAQSKPLPDKILFIPREVVDRYKKFEPFQRILDADDLVYGWFDTSPPRGVLEFSSFLDFAGYLAELAEKRKKYKRKNCRIALSAKLQTH